MRKLGTFTFLLTLALAIPLYADDAASGGRDQSYFTYDDGGTIIKQGDDGREVDARVNLPLFPGDEVTTNRRGRSEIRLSDGNVIALDRSTSILFKSILDSYDGDASQTIAQMHYGHVVVQRTDRGHDVLRLDTDNASYVASDEAIYAVDADGRGRDRVTVFEGTIEVRTPAHTQKIHNGEEGHVDDQGVYGLAGLPRGTADEFERWFLGRTQRYERASSRYLDGDLAYYDDTLSANGNWVYVGSYGGWCWRPYVGAGWRPYYSGHWVNGRSGSLVWVSYEPWGWVPYHYGRWCFEAAYGWIWLPGYAYSPAWVYWMYGPGYIGWAPAGWYDCYRPYYGWAYNPRLRGGFGFGFYGRVRVHEVDLRPWTFVNPNVLISNRVDRAALTTDAVRERLRRDNGGFATVSSNPARFNHNELRDPAAAVNNIVRRGIGGGTGNGSSGSPSDMTPFFRRDPELPNTVRERVTRTRGVDVPRTAVVGVPRPSTGVPVPRTPRTREGRVSRDGGGGSLRRDDTPAGSIDRGGNTGSRGADRGSVRRDTTPSSPDRGGVTRETPRDTGSTGRERIERPAVTPRQDQPAERTPSRDDSWRGRAVNRGDSPRGSETPRSNDTPRSGGTDRGSDVPRRVIDRIGGARVYPGDSGSSTSRGSSPRNDAPPPRVERSSPPPEHHHDSPPPQRSSDSGHSSSSGSGSSKSGSSDHGGHVHREH